MPSPNGKIRVSLALLSVLSFVLHGWRLRGVCAQELAVPVQMKMTPVFDPSINSLSEDYQRLIKRALVESAVSWFQEVLKVRPLRHDVVHDRDCIRPTSYLVKGERYCGGDCAPVTRCGPVAIPEEYLKPCKRCSGEGLDCETVYSPPPTSSSPISGSHFIIHVASLDEPRCQLRYGPPLYGGHCQLEKEFDRPVSGYLNICPGRLSTDPADFHIQLSMVVHEMLHILVFSDDLFPYFRDENGRPRTQRTNEGQPGIGTDGRYLVDPNTVRSIRRAGWATRSGDVFHDITMLVTPNVVREARAHFDCPTVLGAELENQGGQGTALSHWEKRTFGEEVMTAFPTVSSVVSRVTLALMEDSGWYMPDYDYAGELLWGRKQGCAFVDNSCARWMEYAKEMVLDASPFCSEQEWRVDRLGCSEQRTRIGKCYLRNYTFPLPSEYQYLGMKLGGSDVFADYCPLFYTADYSNFKVGWSCEDPENAPVLNIARENYGQESRCFRQGDEWVVKNSTGAVISTQGRFGAGCYQFRCSGLRLFIDVKGSSKEVRCGKKGQKKHVTVEENGLTYEGTLICPDYDELCSTYDCLNLCSGHGTCTNGSCKCQPGYFGDDCSRSTSELLLSCSEVACQNGSSCHDTEAGFSCICPSGRTGAYCESELVPDPCVGVNCNGNGVCFRTRLGRQFECQCYDGYTGKECNDILDLCTEAEIPCRHGTCVNTTTPMCECEPFYFGPQCDERTEYCTPDPCENGGTCINRPEESTYECNCPHTHEGENCETEILDPCEETSCLSNQTCERINNFRFRCTCPEGFEGDSCEKKIDYCADSPCLNGGTCINHETLYECVCPRGYKGRRCKNRRNPCIPDPCLHGRCQKDENGPYGQIYCECEEGHRGEFCEDKIPTCFPNPCRNGGTCTEYGGGNSLCTCPPGYDDGMYCEGPVCPLGLSGQNCSDPVPELPQFSGNSHLFLSAPHESALTSFIITVSVKPQQPNGLIFLRCLDGNKDGDFISIGLKEGIVEFRFDPRTGPAVIRSHRVLEMNQWHIVTATRHSRNGSLYVNTDPNYPASGVSKGAFVHMNLERSVIYIGGYSNVSTLPDRFGEYTSGFHGCVSHLEVNGHMLDIVANSTKTNVNQCQDSGPCSKTFNACELGGRCRASDTDYWCECRAGYSGISCNSSVVPAEPSFNGQSYLAMEATSGSFLNINISITLTPISGDGLILLIATDSMKLGDFVAVGLNSSTVEFYFNQMDISSDDFYVESSEKLVTGSRNTVTLLKRGAEGSVQVNQGLVAHGVTIGPHRFLHVSDQALVYIGGHPTWDTVPQSIENYDSGFHGCIHQVVLNERLLDLTQACSSRQTSECILPSGT